jgi:hypothetical protein
MSDLSFVIRLSKSNQPAGQIPLTDLASLARRIQDLAVSVARWAGESYGTGRLATHTDQLAKLNLSALQPGSTCLMLERDAPASLDLPDPLDPPLDPLDKDFQARFRAVLAGIGNDSPPPDAPDLVKRRAGEMLKAFRQAADTVSVQWRGSDGGFVPVTSFTPADLSPEVWEPALPTMVATAAFTGRLEAVDLRRGWFRVTDQAGTDLELTEVGDPLETAKLIGGIVTASGDLRDSGGRLSMANPAVTAALPLPGETAEQIATERFWDALSAQAPPPTTGPSIELTSEEWEQFWGAIRGS